MEDGASNAAMPKIEDADAIDFMDELLYDGFWIETTTQDSNFWHPSYFPTSFVHTSSSRSSFLAMDDIPNQKMWFGPNTSSVRNRLMQAIDHVKDSIRDKDVLIQIWIPIKEGGRQLLTTNKQPFSLNPNCKNLADYRDASSRYQFAADEGLPGRVFINKLPEWTPDVRFFKREEYRRVNDAQQYDVRGSLALPVFEQGSGNCLGVVEIVTTTQTVHYLPELENMCRALEAVDLKSSAILEPHNIEDVDGSYQSALREIRNMLKCACDSHDLPLAQTWAPCIQHGKGGCRHSDENYTQCVSTLDSACYVADQLVSGFHEACSEHHLLKGEGIAGKAFLTNQPCFVQDITAFTKTEYPLAHHARVFNLCAAVAIRLRSTYTGKAHDYVLEFFLPINCKEGENQRRMLDSLSSVIQQTCQSLRVVTDEELDAETSSGPKESSWIVQMMDSQNKGKEVSAPQSEGGFSVTTSWEDAAPSAEGSTNFFLDSKTNPDKRKTKTEKTISLQVLRQYFAGSLKDAAKNIGVCPTTLKRICRQHGITRWPSRKIKKVGHSLKKLQLVMDSVQGAEGSIQLGSFYNFPELISPEVALATETNYLPSQELKNNQPEPEPEPEPGLLSLATNGSKSPSSSGSHSSSASYCCSTGVKQAQSSHPISIASSLKKTCGDGSEHDKKLLTAGVAKSVFRVKAAFGDEKIRFGLQSHWSFEDLQQEVLRRFNINNAGARVDLKYLDDDSEWVLLTCDADLEECIHIHESSNTRNIKMSLNHRPRPHLGSSFGSTTAYI